MALHCEGRLDASIAIVGEALGDSEVYRGRPFAGSAGRLLRQLLASANICEGDVYFTNVFNFHPHKNDITPYLKLDTARRKASTSETFDANVARLKGELEQSKANVIVPVGNTALYALTGQIGIHRWRGSILSSSLLPGRKIVPTIHPSAALRGDYLTRYYIIADLQRASTESLIPEINSPDYRFNLSPSFAEACEWLTATATASMFSLDIEVAFIKNTAQAEITHIAVGLSEKDVMSIPLCSGANDVFSPPEESEILRRLAIALATETATVLGQNLMFDLNFLLRRYGIITHCQIHDTMVAQNILFPDFPKTLAFQTSIYTRQAYYKDDGKLHSAGGKRDEQMFRRYNALDAAVCFPILNEQLKLLNADGAFDYYLHKCRLMKVLLYMQERGMLVDVASVKLQAEELKVELANLLQELHKVCGFELNPKSPKQLADYFYGTLKIKPYTKDKKPTTDVDAMKRIHANYGLRQARLVNMYRSKSTRLSTFFLMSLDADNRLRTSYNPVGAGSRLSSSKTIFGTGMNMQNQPPEIRRHFLADLGFLPINVDLSQAEARVVAYIWDVVEMIAAFESGVDIHKKTASLIFGKPIEEISDKVGSTNIGGGIYSERSIGKVCNHALNYGLGIDRFAIRLEVDRSEAAFLRDSYFRVYPEILRGHGMVQYQLKEKGYLVNLLGKKRRFLDTGNIGELNRAGYDYVPQSTVGDVINMRGLEPLYYSTAPDITPVQVLDQGHDSIAFQYPLSMGTQALSSCMFALKSSLETPLKTGMRSFVIPADFAVGLNKGKGSTKNPQGLQEVPKDEFTSPARLAGWLYEVCKRLGASAEL